MNIVNLIHRKEEQKNIADLTPEERNEIALKLNRQAMTAIGYQIVESQNDESM